ncbi:MAG: type I 3-dehydroquinate dehydratase [Bacteroidales bacterium]|nr:type I 3-dehydroquinate dehydratase [Bacteroidales bacterium]
MKLCICLSQDWKEQWLDSLNKADLLELRIDLMFRDEATETEVVEALTPLLIENSHKIILTCRVGKISQEVRYNLFLALLPFAPAYIDLEHDTPQHFREPLHTAAQKYGVKIITSFHHHDATPDRADLCTMAKKALLGGAGLVKIVAHCRDTYDEAKLLSLYREECLTGKIVAFGMGHYGLTSRLHAAASGAPLLYVAADCGAATAQGQPRFTQFTEHLLNVC